LTAGEAQTLLFRSRPPRLLLVNHLKPFHLTIANFQNPLSTIHALKHHTFPYTTSFHEARGITVSVTDAMVIVVVCMLHINAIMPYDHSN
jgi:hypothetical protein